MRIIKNIERKINAFKQKIRFIFFVLKFIIKNFSTSQKYYI